MSTRSIHASVTRAIVIVLSITLWSSIGAQELEEIVVTAQKREENVQDVPISIAAHSGEQIHKLGWSNAEDIAKQTPGLIGTSFSGDSTVSLFTIRGVGQNDFADHQEAPTAVYVDGAYIGYTGAAGVQLYDLERVEVLRGPQGTLFGRNATGGLIHLISRKPTREFESYLDLTLAEFDQVRIEGAISGPISDTVQGRISVLSDQADGYFKNFTGPDARERDFLNVRAQLAFAPTETFDGLISIRSNQTDDVVAGAYDFRPSFVSLGDSPTDFQGTPDTFPGANDGALNPLGSSDKDALAGTLTLNFRPGNLEITSITDFADLEKFYQEDSDGNSSRTVDYIATQDAKQFSQELRIGAASNRMKWLAGLYYLNLDGDFFTDLQAPTFGGAVFQDYSLETKSWSLFGHVTYDFSDRTHLIVGARYIEDEKDFRLLSTCQPADAIPVGEPFAPGFPANDCALFTSGDPNNPLVVEAGVLTPERDDSDFAAELSLNHDVREDVSVYASYSRGMKGGGFTAPLDGFLTPQEIIYKPEILHSYEVGVKSELFNGKARLNASAFIYDYKDYQAYVFQGLTSQVRNQDAEIQGAEIELTVTPTERLYLGLGLSLLDATVEDVQLASGAVEDQDMITAPDVTANVYARKDWFVGGNGIFSILVDGQYVDEQQYNTTNSPLTLGDDYSVWNARASYSRPHGDNEWEVALFANNVLDETYATYRFDLSAFFGYSLLVHAPPRWVGAEFRYSWR